MPQISIIIPTTRDRDSIFAETIYHALEATKNIDAQILVINDSPGYEPVIPFNTSVSVLNNPGKGVASARNFGASKALSPLLLFLDNDIIISEHTLKHTIQTHHEFPNICINPDWEYPPQLVENIAKTNFGKFLKIHGLTSHKGWYAHPSWKDNTLFPSISVASFHLSISKADFERSGGYNTSFPYAGFEDYDFPKKLKSIGLTFYIDTRICVLHNEADKLSVSFRLNSQEFRAHTRKVAVNLGYSELALNYSLGKTFILNTVYFFKKPVQNVLPKLPANPLFFSIFNTCYKALEASAIYKGYFKK